MKTRKIRHHLVDPRITDDTTVIIKDTLGNPITCGYWFHDNILSWGYFSATLTYLDEGNVAIFHLI